MTGRAGVDEREVRAYLAEKQEGRAIPTAIIAALDSLAAELVTLKDALEEIHELCEISGVDLLTACIASKALGK